MNPLRLLLNVALLALVGPGLFFMWKAGKAAHRWIINRHPEWLGYEAGDTEVSKKKREWTLRKGWDFRQIPLDMKADMSRGDSMEVKFTCAGIDGLVTGKARLLGGADFSFEVPDESTATKIQKESGRSLGNVDVERTPGGRYVVSSRSARDINEAAKLAFPVREVDVRQEMTVVRQYKVSGFGSFEDAAGYVRSNGDALKADNVFIENSEIVDGRRTVSSNGRRLESADLGGVLPAGTFIVTEEEVTAHAGKVSVPLNAGKDAVLAAVHAGFVPGASNAVSVEEPVKYSDGLPAGVVRTFTLEDGRNVTLGDIRDLSSMKALVICTSFEKAREVAAGDISKGTCIYIGKGVSESPSDGMWPVVLDVDSDLLSRLSLSGDVGTADRARLESMGYSADSVLVGALSSRLPDSGVPEPVPLRHALTLGGARIGGVPVSELSERISNASLPSLDADSLRRWAENAGHIQSVTFSLDTKTGMLRVTSVVDGVSNSEERPCTPDEMEAFASRGQLTQCEMKDLLMQSHPDYFSIYSRNGKGMYADPVGDFLKNVCPSDNPSREPAREKLLREGLEQGLRRRKEGPKMKMHFS